MRVLVTGGAGYLGTVLVRQLVSDGMLVTVLDNFMYEQTDVADKLQSMGVKLVIGDVRRRADVADCMRFSDAVVHLAAIVGDPACKRRPEESLEVNVLATRIVADEAERAGTRMIFASTCSNYGKVSDETDLVHEEVALVPLSSYGEQKTMMEQELVSSEQLKWTILRFATLYGPSHRMRFDLTLNEFVRDVWASGVVELYGENTWRPYVDVREAANVISQVVSRSGSGLHEIFNVGVTSHNFRKRDLAELVVDTLGYGKITANPGIDDPRSYHVSFEKLAAFLGRGSNFSPTTWVRELAKELENNLYGDTYRDKFRNS